VLGRHRGIVHYTIGQRRGLNLGGGEALYVLRLDAAARRVVVGPKEALGRTDVPVREVNWLAPATPPMRVAVKLRSMTAPAAATVTPGPAPGTAEVALDEPQLGIAPGQACVFYDGERLLGGGWIARRAAQRAA
jgi:tRNA-specific 2-thiouridylase